MTCFVFVTPAPSDDDGRKVLVIIAGSIPHARKLARGVWTAEEVQEAEVTASPQTTGIVYSNV